MKKTSHTTIFIFLGLLALLFATVFGLQYWKSEYGFKEVQMPEVEQEAEQVEIVDNSVAVSEVPVIEEILEVSEEEKNEQAFQDFLNMNSWIELKQEEFLSIKGDKENRLVNISYNNNYDQKEILKKSEFISYDKNCFIFKDMTVFGKNELCNNYNEGEGYSNNYFAWGNGVNYVLYSWGQGDGNSTLVRKNHPNISLPVYDLQVLEGINNLVFLGNNDTSDISLAVVRNNKNIYLKQDLRLSLITKRHPVNHGLYEIDELNYLWELEINGNHRYFNKNFFSEIQEQEAFSLERKL